VVVVEAFDNNAYRNSIMACAYCISYNNKIRRGIDGGLGGAEAVVVVVAS
jgi:hypothetical protein